jgi:hypothetical protein
MLILAFKGEDDVLDEMEAQCGKLGPACMAYLESKFNSSSLAAAINSLGAIVREAVIQPDQVAGLAAANKRYTRLTLPEDVLVALILLKLPADYTTVKTIIIQADKMPTVAQLSETLQVQNDFFNNTNGGHAAFSGFATQSGRTAFCSNCDERGHVTRDCAKPKVPCQECGDQGHLATYCFVRNEKPLVPQNMTADKKQLIESKRIAYKASKMGTNMTAIETEVAGWMRQCTLMRMKPFLDMLRRQGP